MDWLIPAAHAQAGAAQQPSLFAQLFPLIALMVVFYFLLIRPQMKRSREHRDMLGKLSKGDELVLSGGVTGKLVDIGESFLTLEIDDNVRIKVQKQSVASVLPKGTLKQL